MAAAVSLLELFRTGRFGPLEVGMRRAEVAALLGRPDDYGVLSRREGRRYKVEDHWRFSALWRYGGVELLFDGQGCLRTLHMDYLDERALTGGERLALDAWLVRPGLSLAEAEAALRAEGLAFAVRPDAWNAGVVCLVLVTGARLSFALGEDAADEGRAVLCLLEFPDRLQERQGETRRG